MLKINRSDRKKSTTAIIDNSEYDALFKVMKRLGVNHIGYDEFGKLCICPTQVAECMHVDKLFMNPVYTGTTYCDERDVYNEEIGEDVAVKKAMDNHKAGFTRAIKRWQTAMIRMIIDASPETFVESYDRAMKEYHRSIQ